jgi:hypothetical protein
MNLLSLAYTARPWVLQGWGAAMGREVEAQAQYKGQTGVARVLLESDALILRGGVRARIPRLALQGWRADADDLVIDTAEGPLMLTIGAATAAKWVAALDKPLPTLAEKLGVGGARLWLMGDPRDAALAVALQGVTMVDQGQATLGLAVLRSQQQLDALIAVCRAQAALPIWAINEKGPRAALPESAIRTALRATGRIDTKACAVSQTLSGTRYQRPKA